MSTTAVETPAGVPAVILRQLARLRASERTLRTAWGAARTFAVIVAALVVACFIDWWIDRQTDTPFLLRLLLTAGQLALAGYAAWVFIVRPCTQGLDDDRLASWAEEHFTGFRHKLVTALQLNRPAARTQGMSSELIQMLTAEAASEADKHDFTTLPDRRRWTWAAQIAAPCAAVGLLLFACLPGTVWALLQRQLLLNAEVPRWTTLKIADDVRERWPGGDEVELRFYASGRVSDDLTGLVRIYPDGMPSERYPLTYAGPGPNETATFVAKLPAMSASFDYRAWLGDGRTKTPGRVVIEPRPVIASLEAFVVLPDYLGKRPDGRRYEQQQAQGEVVGSKDADVRVEISVQKPIAKGTLQLLGRLRPDDADETILRTEEFKIIGDTQQDAVVTFTLRPEEFAYRIIVEDKYGFSNNTPPRRGITIAPDETPVVALLPERFPGPDDTKPSDDSEVDGMPVPLGGRIRIAYFCRGANGLKAATLVYRVIKGGGMGGNDQAPPEELPEVKWKRLPLTEVLATAEAGTFDFRRGVFERTGLSDQVEFHAIPSPDPGRVPGRLEGGGRLDFQTKALPELRVGDQVEYYVEVTDRNPAPGRKPGQSETRVKTVVTEDGFIQWVDQTLQQESKLRTLEDKQRGIFGTGTKKP
jgi:hypothetical protein